MEQVRAKMKCVKNETAQGGEILLTPVVGGSAENDEFYEATPDGSVHLRVLKPPVAAFFKEGCEYYVDFCAAVEPTDAEKAERYDAEHGGPYLDNSTEAIAERARLERERLASYPLANPAPLGDGHTYPSNPDGKVASDQPRHELEAALNDREEAKRLKLEAERRERERLNSDPVDGKAKKK